MANLTRSGILVCLALLATTVDVVADSSAPRQPLDLESLVREATSKHPSTLAARHAHRMLEEVPSQAGSLPDPVLVTSLQNFRIDDFGLGSNPMTGILVGLSQGIPFPGKLPRRRVAAERAADVAAERILAVNNALELRVRVRYWTLHYAEQAVSLVRESEKALNTLTNVVHARYSVGQGAQQDALQAQVALGRLQAHLQQLVQVQTSAQRALNTSVGRPPTAGLAPTRVPPKVKPLLSRPQLAKLATQKNPDLRVTNARTRAASASVAAFHRDRLPDFAIGLGYRLRAAAPGDLSNGADMVSLTLSMTLPIWANSKQNARTRQARKLVSVRRQQTASLYLDVHSLVASTVDEIDRLTAQVALYKKGLLPAASQALGASIGDYQVGRVEFVSVLQNWRAELDVKLEFERLLTDRASRMARLRALCGGPVERSTP